MITDLELVLAVAGVAAAVVAGLAVGYLAGARHAARLRRRLAEAELALDRATGGTEDILRAVTTRRGHARQTRSTTTPRRTDGHH